MAHNITILKTNLGIAKDDVNTQLSSVKEAIRAKNLDAYNKGMKALADKVKVLNTCEKQVKYAELLASDAPVINAVKEFYLDLSKAVAVADEEDGAIKDVTIEKKKARIDLEAFCKFGDLSTEWARNTEKLLVDLTVRETNVFSMDPAKLAKESFYFIQQVSKKKEIELAKKEAGQDGSEQPQANYPSNTSIVKLLQKIIDDAIFVDDGNGKNAYKCNNHDIAFIHDAVTKIDTKEKCTIAMLNSRQFKTVMMSVFAHCLGEKYSVKSGNKSKAN